MSTRTLFLLTTLAAAAALALTFGAATGSAASAAKPKVVPIVMRDPGCHWFSVGGKTSTRLVVQGATTFRNLDEAALVFAGKGYLHRVAVGKTLTVATPGTYRITMVGQHGDDNHLLLVVE